MFSPHCSIPRPEYPRPDRQRGRISGIDWLNLNGPWDFRFDPQRVGLQQGWHRGEGPAWHEQILVPFCWESLAAWGEADTAGSDNYYSTRVFLDPMSVTHENHRWAPRYEVGWYRRQIEIPQTPLWDDKRVILTIGAADYFTDCWCNGIHLGHHEGGYLPFEFDLTEAMNPTGGTSPRCANLVLRVEDPRNNSEQPVGKQWGWYTTTSGIWQTVFLEPRSAAYIESFRITPDIDAQRVLFESIINPNEKNLQLTAEIIPPEGSSLVINFSLDRNQATGQALLQPLWLWDTANPKIYHVVFRLKQANGIIMDEVRSYFGMRKISTTSTQDHNAPFMLCLNNQPIYLRGALYQSYHPEGVYTALNAARLQNDIICARNAGFDFLRIHIKLDDPLLLYYADQLGMLIMQDFPNFGEGGDTVLGRQRFETMMRQGISRDFNHPCIIAWCIFNETWGFGGQAELIKMMGPRLAEPEPSVVKSKIANTSSFTWIHEMWLLAKGLDPTRLIEDMSVVKWEHLDAYGHVDTDINSWHFYIDDYDRAKAHIDEVVAHTYPGSSYNYISGFKQRNVPLINSEFGGVGALDGSRDISWSFKFLTNELRRHGQISAYIYTELTDVEWEHNGFVNYDRTPKEFGYNPVIINQGDVLPINAAPITRYPPNQCVEVEVLSSHFSRRHWEGVTFHWLYSGVDSLGLDHPQLQRGYAAIPFTHHAVEVAKCLELWTPSEVMLCTLAFWATSSDGKTIASNFVQHFICQGPPSPKEMQDNRLILRQRVAEWTQGQWSGRSCSQKESENLGLAYGYGTGYFEWTFDLGSLRHGKMPERMQLLFEISACREGYSQTSGKKTPTALDVSVNEVLIHHRVLPDHPHDARGSLSYLRGQRGAYGYLVRAPIPMGLWATTMQNDGLLRVRCASNESLSGGLSIYDQDCGRWPIGPTLVINGNVNL